MIRFGTSGWRARIAGEFTFDNVRLVAQAAALYWRDQAGGRPVIVGYDTRFLSERFASEAARVLAENGLRVLLSNRAIPTPTVAHAITHQGAVGGLNITASHNPPEDNGIKISGSTGAPLLPEATREIEALIVNLETNPSPGRAGVSPGAIEEREFVSAYLQHLERVVDFNGVRRQRLKVIVDVQYGTAFGILDRALTESGAEVRCLHGWRDVMFGGHRPEPTPETMGELVTAMKEAHALLGLATDGDADRFGVVDRDGSLLSANQFLAVVLYHLLKHRGWRGGVARSVATTHLLDAIAKAYGCPVLETPVGFKYLGELLTSGQAIFVGEESGGMSLRGHLPEKDGILAGLLAAEIVAVWQQPLSSIIEEIHREVGPKWTARVDMPLTPAMSARLTERLASPPDRIGSFRVQGHSTLDGLKCFFDEDAWILIRASGTEPLARLYIEASSGKTLGTLRDAAQRHFFES
jgi:alpha-D-glucose phosphate-specific phosphoglucomutase